MTAASMYAWFSALAVDPCWGAVKTTTGAAVAVLLSGDVKAGALAGFAGGLAGELVAGIEPQIKAAVDASTDGGRRNAIV